LRPTYRSVAHSLTAVNDIQGYDDPNGSKAPMICLTGAGTSMSALADDLPVSSRLM
jgi:hypothetical protein